MHAIQYNNTIQYITIMALLHPSWRNRVGLARVRPLYDFGLFVAELPNHLLLIRRLRVEPYIPR